MQDKNMTEETDIVEPDMETAQENCASQDELQRVMQQLEEKNKLIEELKEPNN